VGEDGVFHVFLVRQAGMTPQSIVQPVARAARIRPIIAASMPLMRWSRYPEPQ